MLQVVSKHCEIIFCLLSSPKCDLVEVEKEMILVVEWYFVVIFCLTSRKGDNFKSIKRRFKLSNGFESYFLPLDKQVIRLW